MTHDTSARSHNYQHAGSRTSHQYQNDDGLHRPHPHAVKRPRTMSQQTPSSQKMVRVASNLSTRSAVPFTSNTPLSPPAMYHMGNGLQEKHAGHGQYLLHDNLVPSQSFPGLMQQMPADKQSEGMSSLPEMGSMPTKTGVVFDPADWLAQHPEPASDLVAPFHHVPQQSTMNIPEFNMTDSVCGSMTSGPTDMTTPMTRENSQFDAQPSIGGVRMVNRGSQMSPGQDTYFPEGAQPSMEYGDASFLGKQPSHEEALFDLAALAQNPCRPPVPIMSSEMERSLSSSSTASTKSTSSLLNARAKDTLRQTNRRAQNAPLKPKPVEESKTEPASDDKNDGKAVIAKTKKGSAANTSSAATRMPSTRWW
ncbi:hypothetical protein ONZ43_g6929 [Nemania bipapillata]|uniref:Uncharacterized protein n=1 Tax=Nemania bipapillata TaxID=110536 RepID=A0ACC2HV15_9PEZI|nr:hypothetical protein ONZ43_g6929 [Nemania bipapillata]